MEVMLVPPEILDQVDKVMALDSEVPVAQRPTGKPRHRGKVYRALLSLETDRFSVALLKNNALLFPKKVR